MALTPAKKLNMDLANIDECFPASFTEEQKAKAKTVFYKKVTRILIHSLTSAPLSSLIWRDFLEYFLFFFQNFFKKKY
jgi:hypothetical protein